MLGLQVQCVGRQVWGAWWLWVSRAMTTTCHLRPLESTASTTAWSLVNVMGVPWKLRRLLGSLVVLPGTKSGRGGSRSWLQMHTHGGGGGQGLRHGPEPTGDTGMHSCGRRVSPWIRAQQRRPSAWSQVCRGQLYSWRVELQTSPAARACDRR